MNQIDKPIANPIVLLREEFDDWAILFNPDTADIKIDCDIRKIIIYDKNAVYSQNKQSKE